MSTKIVLLAFVFFAFSLCSAIDVSYDERALTIDGERRIILSGSIHYTRSTAQVSFYFCICYFYFAYIVYINLKIVNICFYRRCGLT